MPMEMATMPKKELKERLHAIIFPAASKWLVVDGTYIIFSKNICLHENLLAHYNMQSSFLET